MEKFGDIGRKKGSKEGSKGKGKNAEEEEEEEEEEGESGEVRDYIGKDFQHEMFWRSSSPRSMICIGNSKAFEQQTSSPESFKLKLCSYKIGLRVRFGA